jgi:hypothetical protein
MKTVVEEMKLHTMAKVHDCLEMWQSSQYLGDTQNESRAENKQMTAVGYISHMKQIVIASWSLFQQDGAAAFKLSERPPLRPGVSAKDLPGGQTQTFNACLVRRINRYPVASIQDCALASISDSQNWLNWKRDFDNPNDSKDDCATDDESDIVQHNGIEVPECPEPRDVSAAPNVPRLIWPAWKSTRQAKKVLVTVNALEMRSNMGVKKM